MTHVTLKGGPSHGETFDWTGGATIEVALSRPEAEAAKICAAPPSPTGTVIAIYRQVKNEPALFEYQGTR